MGEALRTVMDHANLSQQDLAKRLNRSQSYVSDMLTGKVKKYDVGEVSDWAEACDANPLVVFGLYFIRLARRP
jgi:transcriptional regulator with XRE-family HTH domain